ncbi:hypothetical protein Q1695_004389 [Nippostrongylus brasiliensis]|nr:hypothetical protein Q1695_004389 [Nippostrongylus brasiliensis]
MNDGFLYLFQGKESFEGDVEGVSSANQEILEILNEKNRTAVRDRLLNLLTLQTSALIYLGSSCNGTTSEEHACNKGLEHLYDATCELVAAVKELAEVSQLEAIQKVGTCPKGSEDKNPELAYGLGMDILEALESTETLLE